MMRIEPIMRCGAIAVALASSGFANASPDPFTMSNEAVMARVALELPLGRELTDWLESADDSKVVLVNLEDNHYTDDTLPEYMVHDVLSARLTDDRYKVRLLDRDPDLMTLVNREQKGLDLPFHMEGGEDGVLDSLTREQRRYEVGRLIAGIIHEIAPQDVLVTHEASCCADGTNHTQAAHTNIIANEVGTQKAKLLRGLLADFEALFPAVSSGEEPTRHVDLNTADYLVAYRVYDFGNWSFKEDRITYIKLHVRVIDMKNAAIVASDTIEHKYEDRISSKNRIAVLLSHARQSDYGRPATRSSKKWRDPDYVEHASASATGGGWDGTTIIDRVIAEQSSGRFRSGRRAERKAAKAESAPIQAALPTLPVESLANLDLKIPGALTQKSGEGGIRAKIKRKKGDGSDSPIGSVSVTEDEDGGMRAKLKLKKGDGTEAGEATASSKPSAKPSLSMPSIDFVRVGKITGGSVVALFGVTRLLAVPAHLDTMSYYGELYSDPSSSENDAAMYAEYYNQAIKDVVTNGVLGLALVGGGSVLITKSISMTPTARGLVFSGTW